MLILQTYSFTLLSIGLYYHGNYSKVSEDIQEAKSSRKEIEVTICS